MLKLAQLVFMNFWFAKLLTQFSDALRSRSCTDLSNFSRCSFACDSSGSSKLSPIWMISDWLFPSRLAASCSCSWVSLVILIFVATTRPPFLGRPFGISNPHNRPYLCSCQALYFLRFNFLTETSRKTNCNNFCISVYLSKNVIAKHEPNSVLAFSKNFTAMQS